MEKIPSDDIKENELKKQAETLEAVMKDPEMSRSLNESFEIRANSPVFRNKENYKVFLDSLRQFGKQNIFDNEGNPKRLNSVASDIDREIGKILESPAHIQEKKWRKFFENLPTDYRIGEELLKVLDKEEVTKKFKSLSRPWVRESEVPHLEVKENEKLSEVQAPQLEDWSKFGAKNNREKQDEHDVLELKPEADGRHVHTINLRGENIPKEKKISGQREKKQKKKKEEPLSDVTEHSFENKVDNEEPAVENETVSAPESLKNVKKTEQLRAISKAVRAKTLEELFPLLDQIGEITEGKKTFSPEAIKEAIAKSIREKDVIKAKDFPRVLFMKIRELIMAEQLREELSDERTFLGKVAEKGKNTGRFLKELWTEDQKDRLKAEVESPEFGQKIEKWIKENLKTTKSKAVALSLFVALSLAVKWGDKEPSADPERAKVASVIPHFKDNADFKTQQASDGTEVKVVTADIFNSEQTPKETSASQELKNVSQEAQFIGEEETEEEIKKPSAPEVTDTHEIGEDDKNDSVVSAEEDKENVEGAEVLPSDNMSESGIWAKDFTKRVQNMDTGSPEALEEARILYSEFMREFQNPTKGNVEEKKTRIGNPYRVLKGSPEDYLALQEAAESLLGVFYDISQKQNIDPINFSPERDTLTDAVKRIGHSFEIVSGSQKRADFAFEKQSENSGGKGPASEVNSGGGQETYAPADKEQTTNKSNVSTKKGNPTDYIWTPNVRTGGYNATENRDADFGMKRSEPKKAGFWKSLAQAFWGQPIEGSKKPPIYVEKNTRPEYRNVERHSYDTHSINITPSGGLKYDKKGGQSQRRK
ncbi:MAG: hypothetical protein Q8P86_00650 [bacterium]|nr:hypothetical protein [bacterium]